MGRNPKFSYCLDFFDGIESKEIEQGSDFGTIPYSLIESKDVLHKGKENMVTSLWKNHNTRPWFHSDSFIVPFKYITKATIEHYKSKGYRLYEKVIKNISREVKWICDEAFSSENPMEVIKSKILDGIEPDLLSCFWLGELSAPEQQHLSEATIVSHKNYNYKGFWYCDIDSPLGKIEERWLILFGSPLTKRMNRHRFKVKFSPYSSWRLTPRYVDGVSFFSALILYDVVYREFKRIKTLSEEEKQEDMVYRRFKSYFESDMIQFDRRPKDEGSYVSFFNELGIDVSNRWSTNSESAAYLFGKPMPHKLGETLLQDTGSCSSYAQRCLAKLFFLIYDEYEAEQRERQYEKNNSSYALSFMTKKNIPKKVQKEMENSGLNEFFDYVEFDEECDLSKISEISKEYAAFSDKFLGRTRFSGESIRFRRLGNHKASGLYYPLAHSLCVDIGTPSSLIHENFHLIDYMGKKSGEAYSRRYSFGQIYDKYKKLIESDPKSENLKGKYDLSYFLCPTEVFARCGEMYVVRCLGVNFSLCNYEGQFGYFEDKELLQLIDVYYKELFNTLFAVKKVAVG